MPRDLAALAHHLPTRLPDAAPITAIRPLAVGFSNETYLVEGPDLIVRASPQGEPLLAPFAVHDVVAQYDILAELVAGLPVPHPMVVDRDGTALGYPFFVMARVPTDGWDDWEAPEWAAQGDDAFRAGLCDELVALYAAAHRLGPLPACGPARDNRGQLAIWHDPVRAIAPPALNDAFSLLHESAPPSLPARFVHGDAKIANILWHHGRIAALLDYEMAFNGDPRWDVGSIVRQLRSGLSFSRAGERLSGFRDAAWFTAQWQARTGHDADAMAWFEAASNAAYAAILAWGAHLHATGRAADARYADFGPVIERLAGAALRLAEQHARR
ncbi:MAG: phosphotransferase family protein [Sphingomonadales bacterium]|nr:phosphotransferase family protein [Sphingomonadales bacterium]